MEIIKLKPSDLKEHLHETDGSILFEGIRFTEGITFSKTVYDRTIDRLRQDLPHQTRCLLVEQEHYFSMWYETANLELNQSSLTPASSPEANHIVALDPVVIDYYQQELASFVGPIASILIQDVLDQNPATAHQFLGALILRIPNPETALAFAQRLILHASKAPIDLPESLYQFSQMSHIKSA